MDSVSPEVKAPEWAEQIEDWEPEYAGPRSKKLTGRSDRIIMGKFTNFDYRSDRDPQLAVSQDLAHLQMTQGRDDSTGEITHGRVFVVLGYSGIILDAEQARELGVALWRLAADAEDSEANR